MLHPKRKTIYNVAELKQRIGNYKPNPYLSGLGTNDPLMQALAEWRSNGGDAMYFLVLRDRTRMMRRKSIEPLLAREASELRIAEGGELGQMLESATGFEPASRS